MLFVRGNKEDYDEWARDGCEGWSYEDVLPYFKKLEDCELGDLSPLRATGGPIPCAELREPTKGTKLFFEAAQEVGIKKNPDYNAESQEGVAIVQMNVRNGLRYNTSRAYLKPAKTRKNLHIRTLAHVTKVLIEDKKAVGVTFKRSATDKEIVVKCRREVILSAGAVGSPQILLLSGIGPKEDLERLGIPVEVDLPGVGRNLQDHVFSFELFPSKAKIGYFPPEEENIKNTLQYLCKSSGPYLSSGVEATVFHRTKENLSAPDLQIHFAPLTPDDRLFKNFGLEPKVGLPKDGLGFGPTLLKPKSLGSIQLATKNPFDHPIINPNYLQHEDDIRVLVDGIKLCRKIAAAPAFQSVLLPAYRDPIDLPWESDEYIREYVKRNLVTVYHPVGTCKMGLDTDQMAVVNNRLQVRGISGLRVADASIMPTIIRGNTNIPCIMIGEKAADLIAHTFGETRPS
jgi:choline dehydrogenase